MAEKMKAPSVDRPELAKHDSAILDLAFAMDCTGSMGSYIKTAQQNIREIVETIVASEKSNVHLALVEYRDHPPQDATFVTRTHDFTSSVSQMKTWLDACSAQGGGDCPEAVADALHDVSKLSWREEATKICVLVSDAPPHGLSQSGDSFPEGCPAGLDPIDITRKLAEKGITLYTVGCEPAILSLGTFSWHWLT
ncbi:blast:Alpha-protein kinase vwkA [Mytilus galloprovincialis]|uniref:Blast:Alpha-protein kinase vwkA n=1 Tax=Mytilus galloprovincialis TaxID=29158 RepID=A0A8B6BSJ9_MYTGA|nr:blast:Alpha-protein kinase vwkA [Mytilus galloprovincialis]